MGCLGQPEPARRVRLGRVPGGVARRDAGGGGAAFLVGGGSVIDRIRGCGGRRIDRAAVGRSIGIGGVVWSRPCAEAQETNGEGEKRRGEDADRSHGGDVAVWIRVVKDGYGGAAAGPMKRHRSGLFIQSDSGRKRKNAAAVCPVWCASCSRVSPRSAARRSAVFRTNDGSLRFPR